MTGGVFRQISIMDTRNKKPQKRNNLKNYHHGKGNLIALDCIPAIETDRPYINNDTNAPLSDKCCDENKEIQTCIGPAAEMSGKTLGQDGKDKYTGGTKKSEQYPQRHCQRCKTPGNKGLVMMKTIIPHRTTARVGIPLLFSRSARVLIMKTPAIIDNAHKKNTLATEPLSNPATSRSHGPAHSPCIARKVDCVIIVRGALYAKTDHCSPHNKPYHRFCPCKDKGTHGGEDQNNGHHSSGTKTIEQDAQR